MNILFVLPRALFNADTKTSCLLTQSLGKIHAVDQMTNAAKIGKPRDFF